MKFNKMFLMGMILSFSSVAMASSGGDDAGNGGNSYLARAGVFQYTCIGYVGMTNTNGDVVKTGYAKYYLNYLGDSLPDPILDNPFYVCHDDQLYGSEDSYEYPRLELVPNVATLFSRFDTRFGRTDSGKLAINAIIDERMSKEHGITTQSDLFRGYEFKPSYGYFLRPFINTKTNEYFCPSNQYSDIPYIKVLTDYTGDTEGLYYGEVEGQVVKKPDGSSAIVSTKLLVPESKIMKYGFFLRDGQKHRVSLESLIETDTVMFYYPYSDSLDPLVKGARKTVVIRATNSSETKKIGCIFKNEK